MARKPRRLSLNSLRNITDIRKMIKPEAVSESLIQALANKGEDLINKAYQQRGWENRTWNLHDSYVSAVFVNGRLRDDTIRFVDNGREMSRYAVDVGSTGTASVDLGAIQTNGREEAYEFLKGYRASGRGRQNTIQLVVGAAMFYSGILESKGYAVLANIEWELIDLLHDGIMAEGLVTTSIPVDGYVHRLMNVSPGSNRFRFNNV